MVCVQYSITLMCMAGPGSSHGDRAKWNKAEINGMLDYLDQHKSIMGEVMKYLEGNMGMVEWFSQALGKIWSAN